MVVVVACYLKVKTLRPTRKIIKVKNQQYIASQGGQGTFFLGIIKIVHPKYYKDLKKCAHQSHLAGQNMGWFPAD